MSLLRPVLGSACRQSAAPSLRAQLTRQSLRRGYADQAAAPPPPPAPKPASSSSNLPLVLGLGGLAGLGGYYYLGGAGGSGGPKADAVKAAVAPAAGALDRKEFREFVLKEIKPYNHDSSTFVFELPDNAVSGLRVASAVLFKGAGEGLKDADGKEVIRPYTPVTAPDAPGHIDFIVKKYGNGNMSKHVHDLKVGDKLALKGPIDKFEYKPNVFEKIGMIAGGSGITPMWQVIQSIAENPEDKTQVTLIYTNKTDKDILLREEFDQLAQKDSRFKIVYGLDKKPRGFNGGSDAFEGRVAPEHISKHLPEPALADKIKVFVCGPPPQLEAVSGGKGPKGSQGELKGLLADAGYQPDQIYKF